MAGWMRKVRGAIGTGLAFSVGGGLVGLVFGTPFMIAGDLSVLDLVGVAARFGVVAFLIGVVFSGVLALTARGSTLEKLSLRRVTALGAGLGLLYFALIATNGIGVWSLRDALLNLASLTLLGGGSAAAILLLARRARHALADDDAPADEAVHEVADEAPAALAGGAAEPAAHERVSREKPPVRR